MIEGSDDWFCTTVYCMVMVRCDPKLVVVCVLRHYCNCNEVCAFFGHIEMPQCCLLASKKSDCDISGYDTVLHIRYL